MAIRRTSSGLTTSSLNSFLSGIGKQVAALQAQQEDDAYNNGLTTDDDYIKQLAARKKASGVTALASAQLQSRIDDLTRTTSRKQLQADIDLGKKNYGDLLTFEQGELNKMVPGSSAYNDQSSRVDTAQQDIVKLARQRIKQAVDTKEATPRDLSDFERNALDVFQPGSLAYESQLAAVQDADRLANKYDYNNTKAAEDAVYEGKLADAKRRNDSYAVAQLVQDHNKVLVTRVQDNPQYFQNTDGTPDADYYTTMNKVNTDNFMATSFAQSQAQAAQAAGEKALNAQVADIKKAASIDESRIKGEIDDLLKGRVKGLDAQGLASSLADKTQELANVQGAAANSLSQFATLKPELIADVNTYNNDVKSSLTQVEEYAKVKNAGDSFVLYDPTDGSVKPIVATSYDANGLPIAEGAYGDTGASGKTGYLQDASGVKTIIKGGDGVVDIAGANGAKYQYVNYNGQLYSRRVDGNAANSKFVPATDQDKVDLAVNHPDVLRNAGFAPDEIVKMVQGQSQALVDQVTAKLQDAPPIPTSPTPTDQPPEDPNKPGISVKPISNPENSVSDVLQTSDLKLQTQKTQRELDNANATNSDLSLKVGDLTNQQQDLHAQLISNSQMIKQLSDQVATGGAQSAAAQAQLTALQKANITLQKTIDTAKLQGGAATTSTVQDANGSQVTQMAPGQAAGGAGSQTVLQGNGGGTAVPGVKQVK